MVWKRRRKEGTALLSEILHQKRDSIRVKMGREAKLRLGAEETYSVMGRGSWSLSLAH